MSPAIATYLTVAVALVPTLAVFIGGGKLVKVKYPGPAHEQARGLIDVALFFGALIVFALAGAAFFGLIEPMVVKPT